MNYYNLPRLDVGWKQWPVTWQSVKKQLRSPRKRWPIQYGHTGFPAFKGSCHGRTRTRATVARFMLRACSMPQISRVLLVWLSTAVLEVPLFRCVPYWIALQRILATATAFCSELFCYADHGSIFLPTAESWRGLPFFSEETTNSSRSEWLKFETHTWAAMDLESKHNCLYNTWTVSCPVWAFTYAALCAGCAHMALSSSIGICPWWRWLVNEDGVAKPC